MDAKQHAQWLSSTLHWWILCCGMLFYDSLCKLYFALIFISKERHHTECRCSDFQRIQWRLSTLRSREPTRLLALSLGPHLHLLGPSVYPSMWSLVATRMIAYIHSGLCVCTGEQLLLILLLRILTHSSRGTQLQHLHGCLSCWERFLLLHSMLTCFS